MSNEAIAVCLSLLLYVALIYCLVDDERMRRHARPGDLLVAGEPSRCADAAPALDGHPLRDVRADDGGDRDSEEARHARRELDAWEPDETIGVDQHTAERRARLKEWQRR